jgi:hypothetical protein
MTPATTLPRYPVYIPSKGRSQYGQTMRCLVRDAVPFFLVVEPQEAERYRTAFPTAALLLLDRNNGGLLYARNWIKAHATATGAARHWQLDDNILVFYRRWHSRRIPCAAGLALRVCEDFVDRYTNVAVAGLAYRMFVADTARLPPYWLNVHVYSCTLILNSLPYGWRLRYNDDTDLCLHVLTDGWCTVLLNAFIADKLETMQIPGGNTTDLYQGDGRLRMARTLERSWPGLVETKRRFDRPQHVVKDQWRVFDQPLQLKPEIDLQALPPVDNYGMVLRQRAPVKSPELRALLTAHHVKVT